MKKWVIKVSDKADKRLATLPHPLRRRISDAIDRLELGPRECGLDVKQLRARPEWRLRVGGWRVLFLVENEIITITVVSVEPRGDAYK